jgi:hypothetical protein
VPAASLALRTALVAIEGIVGERADAARLRRPLLQRRLSGARSPRAGEVGFSQLLELGPDHRVCLGRADTHGLLDNLQPAERVEPPQLAIRGRVPSARILGPARHPRLRYRPRYASRAHARGEMLIRLRLTDSLVWARLIGLLPRIEYLGPARSSSTSVETTSFAWSSRTARRARSLVPPRRMRRVVRCVG